MKLKFNNYYGSFESVNKIIIIANDLDLRYKLQFSPKKKDTNYSGLASKALERVNASSEAAHSISRELKKILMKMYDEYRDSEGISSSHVKCRF